MSLSFIILNYLSITEDFSKGAWSPWSKCSSTCEGMKQRKRICDFDSQFPCSEDVEVENCSSLCPGKYFVDMLYSLYYYIHLL